MFAAGSDGGRRPTNASIIYWCYVSGVLIQGFEALAFIFNPVILYSSATDPVAQLFVRAVGVALLPLLMVFWSFRHIPIQSDVQVATISRGVAGVFAKFHTMMSLLLLWSVFRAGQSVLHWRMLVGLHSLWAVAMVYALLRNHQAIHGRIIDTSSSGAAARSVVQMIKGDEGTQPRSVMQMIKGEDSNSSKSVMQMIQDEIKTD